MFGIGLVVGVFDVFIRFVLRRVYRWLVGIGLNLWVRDDSLLGRKFEVNGSIKGH